MIFLLAILIGSGIGLLHKGHFRNIQSFQFRMPGFLLLFFVLDFFLNSAYAQALSSNRMVVIALLTLQYSAFFALAFFNRELWPILVIALGEALNYLVMMLNKGRMPVLGDVLPQGANLARLTNGQVPHYSLMNEKTICPFLGDRFLLTFFSKSLLSIGDFVLGAGLLLFAFVIFQNPANKAIQKNFPKEPTPHHQP